VDRWLAVGSANLNEHSLLNDTEVNVVLHDERTVREARFRLWSEHLERPPDEVAGDPARVFDDVWLPYAREQRERRRRRDPEAGRCSLLPNVSRRSAALWGPLTSIVVDG
jgi:phosphatidylserine/phosphatidylglycerophosphate/cardiolipin synthase-like enzyme